MATLSGCERLGATMFDTPRKGTTGCIEFMLVFDTLGLAPTEKMRARAKRLEQIASNALAPYSDEIGSQCEIIDQPLARPR